ncbi:hypothetical protein GCM10010381_43900 [Streptomyces xantholiticus]|nr:hypothetical protein GCM10010381_43900 [Streptomyces xantholiticus]
MYEKATLPLWRDLAHARTENLGRWSLNDRVKPPAILKTVVARVTVGLVGAVLMCVACQWPLLPALSRLSGHGKGTGITE